MTNKLFVAGLSYSTTDQQLEELFAQIGKVLSAKVIVDKYTGQSKGFGFVEMSSEADAKLAMDKLANTQFNDRTIVVKEAKPQEDNNRRFNDRDNNRRDR